MGPCDHWRRSRLSIGLNSALNSGGLLPDILAHGATRMSMQADARAARELFRSYLLVTNSMLTLARHPRARKVLSTFSRTILRCSFDDWRRDADDGISRLISR